MELAVGSVESSACDVIVVSKAGRAGEDHEDISCLAGEPPASPPRDLGLWGSSGERPGPMVSGGFPSPEGEVAVRGHRK